MEIYGMTVGLAGMYQAAYLLRSYVNNQYIDDDILATYLASISIMEPKKVMDIYANSMETIKYGIQAAEKQLSGDSETFDIDINKYVVGIHSLSKKLSVNNQACEALAMKLSNLEWWLEQHKILDPEALEKLAEIYVDIISPLGSKIKIELSLSQSENFALHNKIRATLLAGVRAAILFTQMGGSMFKVTIYRRKILQQLQELSN